MMWTDFLLFDEYMRDFEARRSLGSSSPSQTVDGVCDAESVQGIEKQGQMQADSWSFPLSQEEALNAISMRFGLADEPPRTTAEVARLLDLSPELVSSLEAYVRQRIDQVYGRPS